MKIITISILTLLALLLTACGSASTTTEEPASAREATAIAEAVSTSQAATASVEQLPTEKSATTTILNSDYENAAPVLMQLIVGLYQLESTDQAITTDQATSLLSLLTSLKDTYADNTLTQEQIDSFVEQALSVLTPEQIQAIAAMQITQETAMAAMQGLGISLGGPGQGNGNAPAGGMGQPPSGDLPGGTPPADSPVGAGGPPNADQMGTPPPADSPDGIQRGANTIPPGLLDAIIEFLQTKTTS